MQIKKDRGIRWIGNDGNCLLGILVSTSKTHYEIDVPGKGVIELDRTVGVFEGASKAEVAEFADKQKQEQAVSRKQSVNKQSKSSRTYTVAGYSTLQGVRKVRVANSLPRRVARLQQCGHTDIVLHELPAAMTRAEAAKWLEEQGVD